LSGVLTAPSAGSGLPTVVHYGLRYAIEPGAQQLTCTATMTVLNATGEDVSGIPFVLYRLLEVTAVRGPGGPALPFGQQIMAYDDERTLQVNSIAVSLPSPLKSGDSTTIEIAFNGAIFGYSEVMAYVRDRIDEHYTLLRPDALAYPVLAEPSFGSVHGAMNPTFTYEVSVDVPPDYVVACGGSPAGVNPLENRLQYSFRSKVRTWRIDIGIAKFAQLKDTANQISVYCLPEDEEGALAVLSAAKDVVAFYSEIFGKPENYRGYTIIEIPDGWGSQASDYYFLQSAAAFRDPARISEVYHEIGHTWNVRPVPSVQRCRYFDEAFASYFEALAIRRFGGEQSFLEEMEKNRATFNRWASKDTLVATTPISGYGKIEYGRHSYTKGAWSLYVLNEIVGDQAFRKLIRSLLAEFRIRGVTFGDFMSTAEKVSGKKLDRFFSEWIDGTESSRLLMQGIPIGDIVDRY
jgi:hypothetical protein